MKYAVLLFLTLTVSCSDAGQGVHSIASDGDVRGMGGREQNSAHDAIVWWHSGGTIGPEEGTRLLRNAAERGDHSAEANLGFAYMRGRGVLLDYAEARRWSRKAAEAGIPTGHVNLAYLYAMGYGGEKSILLAYKHYFIAALTSPPQENFRMGQWYEREQMARNPPLTILFYCTAACKGHPGALLALIRYLSPILVIVLSAAVALTAALFRMRRKSTRGGAARYCLSSRWTPFYKFVMGAIWLLALAAIMLLVWLGALNDFVVKDMLFAHGRWILTTGGAAVSLFMAWQCLRLKKLEMDANGFLISNYIRSVSIPFRSAVRVSFCPVLRPELVWIEFAKDTGFGKTIVFMPPVRFLGLYASHPLVERLKALTQTHENPTNGSMVAS